MRIDSRYEVIKKLGTGVWATVYQVKDVRTNNVFTLKHFHRIETKDLYQKFSAENMHQITKLQHPNLIHVSDFGNFGNNVYYLSEYFNGKTLNNFKFTTTSIDILYDIIVQICYALSALHNQEILHKDLKPANVIYRIKNNKPVVKVMDYGFSKIGTEDKSQKSMQNLPYIAPEVYTENVVSPKSDYYSLGVVLYKIVTGSLPYTSEQLSDVVAGGRFDVFPKFPRELNSDIPEELEKLILKLIEKNPQDRFNDIESIITYVNKIQDQKFSYSSKWSIVNRIQFSDYIVRENYSHKLLDYIPIISKGNGKIISLTAGKGLGKNNVLTLFRYHILTNEYFIFDYTCDKKHKDPFFALIKEFYAAVKKNTKIQSDLSEISQKLEHYLFESEEEAAQEEQNKAQLELDFKSASNFIYHLSEEKPIIFIIRAAEHLPKEVFDFVNYISRRILDRPIMIIISLNDPRKLEGLVHTVKIKIDPLSLKKAKEYVERLLQKSPPDEFTEDIWRMLNGNPMFIEKILIDLTINHIIWKDGKFDFSTGFDDYKLPDEVIQDIYLRLAHMNQTNYRHLQKLSWIKTKLSKKLIKYILGIKDRELFFLLSDASNNELLKRDGDYLELTFDVAKQRLNSEISDELKVKISRKVLEYFSDKLVAQYHICKGIMWHAKHVKDYKSLRKYNLVLAQIFVDDGKFFRGFLEYCSVIELDLSGQIKIPEYELKKDLKRLMKLSEWTTHKQIPNKIKTLISKMPKITEKYLILGEFYRVLEKYRLAQNRFEKAYKIAIIGKYKVLCLLGLCKIALLRNKLGKVDNYLSELKELDLSEENEIEYITIKSIYLGSTGRIEEGISLVEDFIPNMIIKNDPNYMIKVGDIYNKLGYLYHMKKFLDEAEKNFQITKKIWEKQKYTRKLGLIYNNIGDTALTKGNTVKALKYFRKSLQVCKIVKCKRIKIHSLLNHGQTYIKLGNFDISENYLNRALKLTKEHEIKPFYRSIINNLAIAKSKINNFSYYYNFIQEYAPSILQGKIKEVTPLIKTYFYYLYEIGDYDKIGDLLDKHKNLFISQREHEFFYQMLGFLELKKKNYKASKLQLDKAFKYSARNKSSYAKTINSIRLLQCFIGLENIEKSYEICEKVEKICEKNNFRYWETLLEIQKIKIQLLDEKINLRFLVRRLNSILDYVSENHLFILELEVKNILVQIYSYLNLQDKAEKIFQSYRNLIKHSIEDLPNDDIALYKKKMGYNLRKPKSLSSIKIVEHASQKSEKWQEQLFDILKLEDLNRMKFFIDRIIQNLFAPHYYCIILQEDIENTSPTFMEFNLESKTLRSKRFQKNLRKCIKLHKPLSRSIKKSHVLFIPLSIKYAKIGALVIADDGEFPFQKHEKSIAHVLRLHLTSVLMRIKEFAELNKDINLMTKLVNSTRKFFGITELNKLEQEIVSYILDFTNSSRGFLIIRDQYRNYKYKVAQDESKNIIKNYSYISKTVLSEVHQLKEPVFIKDVIEDKLFESYIDQKKDTFSIYCAPIIIDSEIYGYIYLDDFNSSNIMKIKLEFTKLILSQISIALKNALQYQELKDKNKEISSLDKLKEDFINIISHELKTPMMSLRGNIKRLKNVKVPKKDKDTISSMNVDINKLYSLIQDLINFNKYKASHTVDKDFVTIEDILETVKNNMEEISKERHMQFKLEIEDEIPKARLNWNAIVLMLSNIVLNSIRFTRDFGTIILGARYSTFQQEKINEEESIVIYVQDNGIGIPENLQEKVFQKFYESNDIISHSSGTIEFKSSGLGLGLSTAKQIVELHGGKIWINSKENEGTTVFVAVPLS